MDGDQETMHDGARREECGEQALEAPQGDERGRRQNCQSSDVASSHESEALLTAVFIWQEVTSDRVVELYLTTVDSRTTQAVVGGVSDWNVSKWKSSWILRSTPLFLRDQTMDRFLLTKQTKRTIQKEKTGIRIWWSLYHNLTMPYPANKWAVNQKG